MDARDDLKYAIYVVIAVGGVALSLASVVVASRWVFRNNNDLFTAYPQKKMGLFICEGPTKVLSIKI